MHPWPLTRHTGRMKVLEWCYLYLVLLLRSGWNLYFILQFSVITRVGSELTQAFSIVLKQKGHIWSSHVSLWILQLCLQSQNRTWKNSKKSLTWATIIQTTTANKPSQNIAEIDSSFVPNDLLIRNLFKLCSYHLTIYKSLQEFVI